MIRDALTVRPALTGFIFATAAVIAGGAFLLEKPVPRPDYTCRYPTATVEPPVVEARPITIRTRLQIEHLPQTCQQYVLALEKLSLCEAMPLDARNALSQAAAMMAQQTVPPDVQAALDQACTQGLDAIRTASASLQCAF